jgi:serine/threonine protein kinase
MDLLRVVFAAVPKSIPTKKRPPRRMEQSSAAVERRGWRVPVQLEIEEEIERGNSGSVYRAYSPTLNRTVAVKEVIVASNNSNGRRGENWQLEMAKREGILLRDYVKHPHIVKCHDAFETRSSVIMVLELAEAGDLWGHVATTNSGIGESAARTITRQLVGALRCPLHGAITTRPSAMTSSLSTISSCPTERSPITPNGKQQRPTPFSFPAQSSPELIGFQ